MKDIHKCKWLVTMGILLFLLMMIGCGKSNQTDYATTSINNAKKLIDTVTMKQIVDANKAEKLLKLYDSFLVENNNNDKWYFDKDTYLECLVDDQENCFTSEGAFAKEGTDCWPILLVGGDNKIDYDNQTLDEEMTLKETITNVDIKDNNMVVDTQLSAAYAKDFCLFGGFEYTEGDIVELSYNMDKDNLALHTNDVVLVHKDGKKESLCKYIFTYNVNKPDEIDEIIKKMKENESLITEDNKRVVSVIANPGTDDEKTYSLDALKGQTVSIIFRNGYSTFYIDKECKEQYTGGGDKQKDITLYTKK